MSRYSTKIEVQTRDVFGKKRYISTTMYYTKQLKDSQLFKCIKFILGHFPNKLFFTCYKGAYEK